MARDNTVKSHGLVLNRDHIDGELHLFPVYIGPWVKQRFMLCLIFKHHIVCLHEPAHYYNVG